LFFFLVVSVEDGSPKHDEDDILSSTRVKQRRATVAPTELPIAKLPRYLRDPGRYGNKTRRQSMPAQYISHQPLPSIRLATETSYIDEEIDKTSDNEPKVKEVQTRPPKSPVKLCKSFPLDHRLHVGNETSPTLEINNSSETLSTSSRASRDFIIPDLGTYNNGHDVHELELTIGFRSSPHTPQRTLTPSSIHTDQIRRHSIAVSKISESANRVRSESLPGMTDLGTIEPSLCVSRDRIISVQSREDVESGRRNSVRHDSERRTVSACYILVFILLEGCLC